MNTLFMFQYTSFAQGCRVRKCEKITESFDVNQITLFFFKYERQVMPPTNTITPQTMNAVCKLIVSEMYPINGERTAKKSRPMSDWVESTVARISEGATEFT